MRVQHTWSKSKQSLQGSEKRRQEAGTSHTYNPMIVFLSSGRVINDVFLRLKTAGDNLLTEVAGFEHPRPEHQILRDQLST